MSSADGSPLIAARNVTRILPGIVPTTLVHGVDLAIPANEFAAITGPSGSGKSSLLYLLGLLDLPTAGEVFISGKSTTHMTEEERAFTRLSTLGFVFQFHFLLPEFTILDHIMLPMRALGALTPKEMDKRARAAGGAWSSRSHGQAAGPALRRAAPTRRGSSCAGQRSAADPGRRADRLA
jgi:lipoprotein-releasing system ATP-binding protein